MQQEKKWTIDTNRIVNKVVGIAFTIMMVWIVLSVNILGKHIDYPCKTQISIGLLMKNIVLVLALSLGVGYGLRKLTAIARKTNNIVSMCVLIGTVVFFILQVYVTVNYYFLTDWDVDLIYQCARELAAGTFAEAERYGEFCWYFSVYPNNMELLGIFVACLKINQYLGILDPENGVIVFIILNCALMAITSLLVYKVTAKLLSKIWGFAAWCAFAMYIGISPWVTIPYSDSLGLLFPVLTVWLCIQLSEKQKIVNVIGVGLVAGLGYYIKPQTSIVLIAVIMIWLSNVVKQLLQRKNVKRSVAMLVVCVLAFGCAGIVPKVIAKTLEIPINSDRTFGSSHFLMMGMNPETNGVYSQEDCDYSNSFDDPVARKQGELEMVKNRLQSYGAKGYLQLLNKKMLTTYADGSFAWGMEGSFWKEVLPEKNAGISHWTREFYYRDGRWYSEFLSYSQAWWLLILLFLCFSYKKNVLNLISIMQLAILGLTAFELLFESRARYLYTFTPLFVILSIYGLFNILTKMKCVVRKKNNILGADK